MVEKKVTLYVIIFSVVFSFVGCSGTVIREYAQPSTKKGQFLNIKKVAVFPFDNFTEAKDAEKAVESILLPALFEEKVFEDVVDPRFVRDGMKKLKIVSTDILDREQVKKLGDELGIQGVIVGKVVSYGKGKDKEASSEVSIDMALVDVTSARILWTGNVTASGGLTTGKVFGVTPGESDVTVARKAIQGLVSRMADSIEDARGKERKGIVAELRKKEVAERRRLEELQQQTKEIEEQIEQANREAEKIKQDALSEAEGIKADIEMEKAAIDAEKSQVESEREAIEREKLTLETERASVDAEKEKLESLQQEKAELEEQINKLKEEIREEPVGDLETKMEEIERLEKDQESLQGEIEGKQEEVQSLEEQLEQVEKKQE